ncbi:MULTISPECIES: abortive infection family protein [Pseudomonas]|uniref:abortive infection family protein n=1 Tax=Pseudomonas TaxID=286 RepID=UPI001E5A49F7|nr:abortive infection family protein [Pseudomonas putida]
MQQPATLQVETEYEGYNRRAFACLRNLPQITSNLTQLRGLYGTGHGKDGQYRGPQPRHAQLAVAATGTSIDFVSETHRYREHTGHA